MPRCGRREPASALAPSTTAGISRSAAERSARRGCSWAWQTFPAGIAGLLALGLLASAVALLNPVPLKLVVDSVLGTRPLPGFLQGLVVERAASPTTAILLLAIGLLIAVAVLGLLENLASTLLRA